MSIRNGQEGPLRPQHPFPQKVTSVPSTVCCKKNPQKVLFFKKNVLIKSKILNVQFRTKDKIKSICLNMMRQIIWLFIFSISYFTFIQNISII